MQRACCWPWTCLGGPTTLNQRRLTQRLKYWTSIQLRRNLLTNGVYRYMVFSATNYLTIRSNKMDPWCNEPWHMLPILNYQINNVTCQMRQWVFYHLKIDIILGGNIYLFLCFGCLAGITEMGNLNVNYLHFLLYRFLLSIILMHTMSHSQSFN